MLRVVESDEEDVLMDPRTRVSDGELQGSWSGDVAVFRGVPFASLPARFAACSPGAVDRPSDGDDIRTSAATVRRTRQLSLRNRRRRLADGPTCPLLVSTSQNRSPLTRRVSALTDSETAPCRSGQSETCSAASFETCRAEPARGAALFSRRAPLVAEFDATTHTPSLDLELRAGGHCRNQTRLTVAPPHAGD